ncbi:hypothetical protein LPBF_10520 [Flavobacterium crassostreae]|uniref:Uncharacterized protein n=1 Tax=Flavobacterium crassostreae TaxID=1763534 RepID=A0A1B9DXJ8_9FLAO|nr:hypothetical protein LPBF_10520 [Flavobacterium crassostreae]
MPHRADTSMQKAPQSPIFWACPYAKNSGSGCLFPLLWFCLNGQNHKELHCHPSRKKPHKNIATKYKTATYKKTNTLKHSKIKALINLKFIFLVNALQPKQTK